MLDTCRVLAERLLKQLGLRFESIELEGRYQKERSERNRWIVSVVMLMSISLFGIFGFWDASDSLSGAEQTRFRFLFAIPLMLLFFGITFTPIYKKGLENFFAWLFTALASILAVAQILHYEPGPLSLDSGTAALNFTLICVAAIGLFPFNVIWSISVGATAIAIYAGALVYFTAIDFTVAAAYLFNIANIYSVLILMSYWRERFTREEFRRNSIQERERLKLSAFLSSYIPLASLDIEKGNSAAAESFGEVTLLFSDIVGFTALTEHLAPKHVLEILDQVFSEFDTAAEKFGVEKVKTIGDAYMAISGKKSGSTNHAKAMVDFALAAIEAVDEISKRTGYPLKIRVGVHTGSTIGGIVGRQKRTYDYWGRAVNLASRLESTGEPNRVHISEATYWRVREYFQFEDRGSTVLRGMGTERSFFIV